MNEKLVVVTPFHKQLHDWLTWILYPCQTTFLQARSRMFYDFDALRDDITDVIEDTTV